MTHVKEGAGQEVRRQRLGGAGEVRREPVQGSRLTEESKKTSRDSNHSLQHNLIEQDHRFVKKKVRASQCFKRFHTAERTLERIEAMNMMRKGQVKRLGGSDAREQATFVASLFQSAA